MHRFAPLDDIITPFLQELELIGYGLPSLPVIDGTISLISRSSTCSLKRLTIHVTGNFNDRLLSLFRLTPNLEELDLLDLPAKNLAPLILTEEGNILLPCLKILTIRQFIGPDASPLIAIQRSRSTSVAHNPAVSYMEPIRLAYSFPDECQEAQNRLEGWVGNSNEVSRTISRRTYLGKNFLGRSRGEITKYKVNLCVDLVSS